MPRVKRGTKRRARRKKLLKHAKGFFLTKGKLYRSAKEAVNRSLRYTYRDRRVRKRDYRTLWIQRIGAAARNNGITYSQLIHGLKAGGIDLDRKILADMAVHDADGFASLVGSAKQHFPKRAVQTAASRLFATTKKDFVAAAVQTGAGFFAAPSLTRRQASRRQICAHDDDERSDNTDARGARR